MKLRAIVPIKKVLILFLLVQILISYLGNTYAALVIDPAFIRLELNEKRNTGTFVLKNTGDEELRYRAKAVYYAFSSQGAIKEIPPDEYSLVEWIKFNPKEFVLPPQTSRVVRYSVIPQGKLKPYSYRGAIEFIPLKVGNIESQDDKGHTYKVKILNMVLVPIYGQAKGIKYSGQIKQLKVNKQEGNTEATVIILNTGNGNLNLNGMCQIINSEGEVVEEIPLKRILILPKGDRIMKTKFKTTLEPGKYSIKFSFQSSVREVNVDLEEEAELEI